MLKLADFASLARRLWFVRHWNSSVRGVFEFLSFNKIQFQVREIYFQCRIFPFVHRWSCLYRRRSGCSGCLSWFLCLYRQRCCNCKWFWVRTLKVNSRSNFFLLTRVDEVCLRIVVSSKTVRLFRQTRRLPVLCDSLQRERLKEVKGMPIMFHPACRSRWSITQSLTMNISYRLCRL